VGAFIFDSLACTHDSIWHSPMILISRSLKGSIPISGTGLQRLALGTALLLLYIQAAQARPLRRHAGAEKTPPVLSYVGGKNPHVTLAFGRRDWDWPHVFHLRTPCGQVTVRWREDSGMEDGGPPPMDLEIAHPDTIFHVVILSPPALPVYFRGAGDAKWAHLNGNRLPAVKPRDPPNGYPPDPFRMEGGLNIVAVAYPDVE